ncbi:MAG: hypothetical protein IKX40_10920, partial [Thermoguttaceae bacterium]|nr:hypothetical protein [Thermoguttaceae bacterium]
VLCDLIFFSGLRPRPGMVFGCGGGYWRDKTKSAKEPRSGSMFLAVGFNPRNKRKNKKTSSNTLFLLPSNRGREKKIL